MQELQEFIDLGLSQESIDALVAKGFEKPTEIQSRCIPLLLKEKTDVIGQAQTGTGKTAAFALPILDMLEKGTQGVQALVLTPTRELCMQVCEEIQSLCGYRRVRVSPIYGGAPMGIQLRELRSGVDIVVGTPGRVMDHLERGTLQLDKIKVCILDEADEMLDMGFIEDIETILDKTPPERRMLCFSATMPEPILRLASRFMPNYSLVRVQTQEMTSSLTRQVYYEIREADKFEALCRTIDIAPEFYGLVFCRTKMQCDDLGAKLISRSYSAEVLHGDLSQKQRELILHKMREHQISILVATDVAARGIDIQELTHVVNYSIPSDPESYIHRIGRTGRAGKTGLAVTFVTPSEFRKFSFIKRVAKTEIKKERLPSVQDIMNAKKAVAEEEMLQFIQLAENGSINDSYFAMAKKLSETHHSTNIIAGLLYSKFKDLLADCKYKPVNDMYDAESKVSSTEKKMSYAGLDESGYTRLFIARGFRDGMDKRMLVDYIMNSSGARNSDINNVEVHDDFSFITVPARVAERILSIFSREEKDGEKPMVTKANIVDNPAGKNLNRRRSANSATSSLRYRRDERKNRRRHG